MEVKMEVIVQKGSITDIECDVAVVNLFSGVMRPGGATGAMDRALDGAITKAIAETGFEAHLGQPLFLDAKGKVPAKQVLVIGLGTASKFAYQEVKTVSQAAVTAAIERGASEIATIIHGAGIGGLDTAKSAQEIAKGSKQGFHEAGCETGKLIIAVFDPEKVKVVEKAVRGEQ